MTPAFLGRRNDEELNISRLQITECSEEICTKVIKYLKTKINKIQKDHL